MNSLQRPLALLLAAAALCAALSGCGKGKDPQPPLTPEARTELYRNAIENARDKETNGAIGVVTGAEDPQADLIFLLLGVTEEDMTAYALSVSPMNVKAYGVAAVLPAAGKEDDVLEGFNAFIDNQKSGFEQYLPDQYEIAKNARLETLEDGTLLLAMCEDQDAVFDSIRDAIEAGQ